MNKRIPLIFWSISLAALLLLALVVLMTASNAAPVRAAPAEAPPAAPLQQSTTTPTYVISDSVTGGITYQWDEISDSGQDYDLDGDNQGSAEIDIGFYFPFYDNVYRTFRASTNGYIYFDDADGSAIPLSVPSSSAPNDFIAPFGANLYMHPDVSHLYVERQSGRTIIEFVDVQWCCGLNDPHTFQIILYRDGHIVTQYRQIRYAANPNERVVAGIENADGSDGIAYYQNWFEEDTSLDDGLAVRYDPGDSVFGHLILDPPPAPWWDDPGQTGTFSVTLFNLTGISDTFDVTYTLQVSSTAVPSASQWPVFVPTTAAITGTLPDTIPNLSEGTFQITATIPVTAGWWDLATLYITASAASSPTLYSTTALTYGVAQRDLSIVKTLDPDMPPAPGGYFRYQLVVMNYGHRPSQARNVRVTDTLPMSITYNADYPRFDPPGDVGTLWIPGFEWNVGDMDANSEEVLDVYMHLLTSTLTGTVLTNTCGVTMLNSVEYGPFINNNDTHTMTVTERRLLLDVAKYLLYPDDDDLVGPGQIITYGVQVENNGNVPIDSVVVSDVIPLNTTFVGTDWPTSTLLPDNRTVVFTVGTMLNGDWNGVEFQVGISIPATTTIGTWLTNTAQVTTTAPLDGFIQAEGGSDSLSLDVTDPRADVWVVKMPETFGGAPVTPEAGKDYTFWINYGNDGNVPADLVTLTDTLPVSYVVLLEAGPAGTAQPTTTTSGLVVWQLTDLTPEESGWTRVRILINEHTPDGTPLVNTAAIAAGMGGNITTTNDVSVVSIILDAADVTIAKWVTPTGTLAVSDTVTYTVRFSNTGAIAAEGVRITDMLPPELTNVTWITSGHFIEPLPGGPASLVWRAAQAMAPGDSGTITITGQLDPAATWPPQPLLTNRAEIRTSTGEEPVNDPNAAQVSNVVALPSPYVAKTGPTLALPGTLVSYTIEYGNGGLLDAHDVRLTDTLPVSTTYVTHTASFTATPASGWITWEVGTIPSQTTGLTFTLVVSVSPSVPPGTPLKNTVELASSTYDGDRTDNESIWITAVGFDLTGSYKQVNGTDGLSVGSGVPVTYTIVLTNHGLFDAPSVSVWDPMPDDATFISNSLSSTGGIHGYDAVGDAITWTGTVSGYSMVTVTFQVTVASGGPLPRGTVITNTAFISDGIQDFQVSVPLTITGPNLDGSYKTANNLFPATQEHITYTIVLENDGEADAIGASFSDPLPTLYVNYTGGGWASDGTLGSGNPVTWTGTVVQGGRVTVTLPVQVIAGPGNPFANTVEINDGTGDVIQRSVTVSTTRPILDVQKVANPGAVAQGGHVTYTIDITNTGNGWAQTALMTDTIQDGDFSPGDVVASSGAVDATTPPTITWTGPISPGFSVRITIPVTMTAAPGSDVPNVARVNDGYGTVSADSTLIHVYSRPDLSNSNKQVDQAGARTGDTLLYTLNVVNDGELPTTFSVNDTLDPNTIFDTFVGSPPGSYGETAGVITWTGTVDGLSQVQLAFEAVVNASVSGAVTNTAQFEGDGNVYTDIAVTQILVPAVLTATKQVEPVGPIIAGEYLTYTIVMRNVGGDDAHATFSDEVPAHTEYINQSAQIDPPPPAHAPPDASGSPITWEGDLASGEAATLTFQVRVMPGTVTGTVISNVTWLQESNEPGPLFSVAVSNTILAPVFTATKQAEPVGWVLPGGRITYTLVVTNESAGIALVAVTDTLPVSTTCIPSSIDIFPTHPLPVCAGGTLTWQDDINSYSFVRLTYAVLVSDSVPIGTVIANSAQVQELSQPDQIVTVGVSHTVSVPSLNAQKRSQPVGTVLAGDEITYTIVLSNSGDAPADVSLSDPIPTHTTYISGSAGTSGGGPLPIYDSGNERLIWLGDLAPHGIVTLTFAVTVNPGTEDGTVITNTAQVQEMSLPGVAFSVTATNPVIAPDVSMVKQVDPPGDVIVGTILSYTIIITNDGSAPAQIVLIDIVPTHTTFVTGSERVTPTTYTPPYYDSWTLTWQDQVGPGQAATIFFQVQIEPGTPSGVTIANVAWMRDLNGPATVYSDTATNVTLAPTFSAAKYNTPQNFVQPGGTINYDIVLKNTTLGIAWAVVTDTIPTNTTYISGSAGLEMSLLSLNPYDLPPERDPTPDPPIYDSANDRLTWEGNVMSYAVITLTFGVTVNLDVEDGTVITNVAWVNELSSPAGPLSYSVTNTVFSEFVIYLPVVMRNY